MFASLQINYQHPGGKIILSLMDTVSHIQLFLILSHLCPRIWAESLMLACVYI